jgi:hypothetical protein
MLDFNHAPPEPENYFGRNELSVIDGVCRRIQLNIAWRAQTQQTTGLLASTRIVTASVFARLKTTRPTE